MRDTVGQQRRVTKSSTVDELTPRWRRVARCSRSDRAAPGTTTARHQGTDRVGRVSSEESRVASPQCTDRRRAGRTARAAVSCSGDLTSARTATGPTRPACREAAATAVCRCAGDGDGVESLGLALHLAKALDPRRSRSRSIRATASTIARSVSPCFVDDDHGRTMPDCRGDPEPIRPHREEPPAAAKVSRHRGVDRREPCCFELRRRAARPRRRLGRRAARRPARTSPRTSRVSAR